MNEGRSSSLLSSALAIEVLCAAFTLGVSFHGRRFAVALFRRFAVSPFRCGRRRPSRRSKKISPRPENANACQNLPK